MIRLTAIFTLLFLQGHSQIFLRLDEYDKVPSDKFFVGDEIEIKTTRFPDTWQKKKIESFIPETNTIVFDQDFMRPDEILALRIDNRFPRILGRSLMQFGILWTTYGSIAYIAGGEFTQDQFIFGASSMASGYLIKKLGAYRIVTMGDGNMFRIIDLRM